MKRSKKAEIGVTYLNEAIYTVECPFCKSTLRGYINRYTLMLMCPFCNNPIDLRERKLIEKIR